MPTTYLYSPVSTYYKLQLSTDAVVYTIPNRTVYPCQTYYSCDNMTVISRHYKKIIYTLYRLVHYIFGLIIDRKKEKIPRQKTLIIRNSRKINGYPLYGIGAGYVHIRKPARIILSFVKCLHKYNKYTR